MRNTIFRLGLKLNDKDFFPYYKWLKEIEFRTIEENLVLQDRNLKALLQHAYRYVPYYTRIFDEIGLISSEGEVDLNKFDKIPILTKKIIRNNFEDLKSTDPNVDERGVFEDSSGGSTGEPLVFNKDKESWKRGVAIKSLFYSFLADYPCRVVRLWGSERDILKDGQGLQMRLMNWSANRTVVNAFKMSEEDMKMFVETLAKKKPDIIESYVQPIYEVSRYINTHQISVFSPKGIITSAGTLYPEMKKVIEEAFGCPVINRYGSREVGDPACSCEKNEGLHVNVSTHYLEMLDDSLSKVQPGEFGKIYVTALYNYSMPLIRYEIGDIGMPAENISCSCGRGLPLIKTVEGREMSVIKTKAGEVVPGEFFIHFIGVVFNEGAIKKFQLIQRDFSDLLIKVVISSVEEFEKSRGDIEASIMKVMGDGCNIDWDFVDAIPPLHNGKYLYIVSEVA